MAYSLWEFREQDLRRVGDYDSLHDALALVPGLAADYDCATMVVDHDSGRLCHESPSARARPDHDELLERLAGEVGFEIRAADRPALGSLEAAPALASVGDGPSLDR